MSEPRAGVMIDDSDDGVKRRGVAEWWWIPALALVILFFLLQVRNFWGNESYYNYGFTVPILAAVLFYWRDRSAPAVEADVSRQRVGFRIAIGLLLLMVPFRMLAEINPFWRVPVIVQGGLLVSMGCLIFWIRGGRPLLHHFLFPVLFLLTMLPWPYRIEVVVIQGFTNQVMRITEAFLLFIGHPANQSGNALLVGGEKIDVNDACSGIRSIQALAMSALFLGELLRLTLLRRSGLLAVTVLLVLFFNSARALALTLLYLRNGYGSYLIWHDRVGWISFAASLAVLYLISEWLKDGRPLGKGVDLQWRSRLFSVRSAVVFFFVAFSTVIISEGWFRVHEFNPDERVHWTLDWSRSVVPAQPQQFDSSVTKILNFDYGEEMLFHLNERREAEVFLYGYTGDDRVKSVSTFGHSPVVCMAASGIPVKERRAPLRIETPEFSFDLSHYVFGPSHLYEAGDLHAFWLVWESRLSSIPPDELVSLNYKAQLQLLAEGRRDFGRQVLLVAVRGARSSEEARSDVRRLLRSMIVPVATQKTDDE